MSSVHLFLHRDPRDQLTNLSDVVTGPPQATLHERFIAAFCVPHPPLLSIRKSAPIFSLFCNYLFFIALFSDQNSSSWSIAIFVDIFTI
ncbi:hypothetical protein AB395_00005325 (plasmid) [Sinorhizobium fredii CCBAU 45436]|nr:hypothetical protein AB395_00005325 [Sinorhizobium fredii CCBAU 45436]